MTEQIPDTCNFDGRIWDIIQYRGPMETIPTNQILGIVTSTKSTANWSGRLNYYFIKNNRLYLFRIQVNLPDTCQDLIPRGARRETIVRTERILKTDTKGTREAFLDTKITNFLFDDLPVYFTGTLVMSYPHLDLWDYPLSELDSDMEYTKKASLEFISGEVINIDYENV